MISFNHKKSLSQNFLKGGPFRAKVLAALGVLVRENPEALILEIGPGTGSLTRGFLDFQRPVVAMELDQRAVEFLKTNFPKESYCLDVFELDALDFFKNPQLLDLGTNWLLLSNLPFHVGSRLLVQMAIHFNNHDFGVILQKEVVQKLDKNSRDITFFGLWINLFWETSYVLNISRQQFKPVPKVDCALVLGRSKQKNKSLPDWLQKISLHPNQIDKLKNLLKGLFGLPRKSLANNLKAQGWTKEDIQVFMIKHKYNQNQRLDWGNYEEILENLWNFKYAKKI